MEETMPQIKSWEQLTREAYHDATGQWVHGEPFLKMAVSTEVRKSFCEKLSISTGQPVWVLQDIWLPSFNMGQFIYELSRADG
jgi:hypothetical protein